MRDPITDAAQDPSCLLCLTPDRGGSWWSPLRQGVIWPGSPRNFAAEPATWYDLMWSGLSFDPSHDYEFTFTFTLAAAALPTTTDRYLMDYGSPVTAIFGAFYANGGGISCCCGLFKSSLPGQAETAGEAITLIPNTVGVPLAAGAHSIRVYAVGNSLYAKLDDGDFIYAKSTSRRSDLSILTKAPATSHNGGVNAIAIRDLTDQSVRWSYPSYAERLRLITNTNVQEVNGHWEAADPALPARIDTALDLRGRVSSYTVIVDFEAVDFGGLSNQKQELAGQGPALASAGYLPICALTYGGNPGGFLQIAQEIAGARVEMLRNISILTGRHVAVGMVIVNQAANQTTLAIYLDGVLVGTQGVYAGIPTGAATRPNFAVNDNRSGLFTNHFGKVYSCLLFDRALSAAEIAALTPKRQPLSWAGIRDIVRRGRAQRYFAVGDVLTVATPRWSIEYEVTGFDQVEPADAALTHSMTLLPVRLGTNLQFDAPEPGNPDANRAQYGCNRWDWSAIRQWLNSAAAPGEWWTAQHEYDAAPAYAATLAGFMADLPADFLNAVAPARLVTALSNAYGGGSVETVDRFWLPSRTEIFGDANNGVAEGVQMAKYIDATDADRIKYNSAGTASGWALRSSNRSNSYNIVNVSANGIMQELSWSSAGSGGIVPACIIA